ncbi:hypothetical protein CSKR_108372 [Clonorchis sinensis]|uniref:RRM domain-containing protein n=1 Tax=Clonorchis sinensis TaxID=79923 RepID=A0A419Q043_CLOSI|nr:hypothetical protein CSKR_108372 [Clonorchis sinensis]
MSVIIRLQNLPMSANASNIRRFFGGLAIPEGGVHIVGGTDGDAFIAFATDEDARKAMLLDRQAINGAPVRLFLSSKTEMQSVIESARSSALFSGVVSTQPSQPPAQKTETMQALDVTAPTLPSSFPSYRSDNPRDVQPVDRLDQFGYPIKRHVSPPPSSTNVGLPQYEVPRDDPYGEDYVRHQPRVSERPNQPELIPRDRDYSFDHSTVSQYGRYDVPRDRRTPPTEYGGPVRDSNGFESASRMSPRPYGSYYGDSTYDRRPETQFPRPKDGPRDDIRPAYSDGRYGRMPPEPPTGYDSRSPKHPTERFIPPERGMRDPRDAHPDSGQTPSVPYPHDNRPRTTYPYDREPAFPPPRSQAERDFSVRPPWLNEDVPSYGSKRPPAPPPELDDYPPKRRPPPSNARPTHERNSPSETDFVVRVTLPIGEVGIKAIFEVLRGVHIIPKWGIRIEEDALQRPTGYVFIMMSARDSFDRALAYDGRMYKSKPVKVVPSSLSEFYKVTDPNFHLKCPADIAKKLPPPGQPVTPPHHADGCLEVADLPPDTNRAEIVRFLGAPGLSASDVTIANFAPGDKSATKTPGSVRALVSLPSAKDLEILLSAKARPLRPDGSFPPVRLTPISRLQLEAYSALTVESKPKSEQAASSEPAVSTSPRETPKAVTGSLTCAYLSGLARPLKDSDVLRLFPSVLIPGDAIRMVGPENTSAYIDLISENNCRRAIEDITGSDSKSKLAHPSIRIEAITRAEMESRVAAVKGVEPVASQHPPDHRPSRPPRDHDPRDTGRPHWESRPPLRVGRHSSPAPPPFRPRSPQSMGRSKYDEPYYDHATHPQPFEDGLHNDPYNGPVRRPRPPMDLPHGAPPPPNDYVLPPRPSDSLPPPRRPGLDFVTVHLSNLPPSVTVDQLSGIMRDYYFVPGSIRLRRDIQGVPTGEALVDFNSAYDGDRVIRDLHGYRMAGRPLVLQYDRRI